MEKRKLAEIEQYIFDLFRRAQTNKLLTKTIFASTAAYANADLVRALEDLEKKWHLLVRYTEEGNDWTHLNAEGATYAGLSAADSADLPTAQPHPPKSAN